MTGVKTDQPATALDERTFQPLRDQLSGRLLRAGDDGFDDARTIWNAMIDRRRPDRPLPGTTT